MQNQFEEKEIPVTLDSSLKNEELALDKDRYTQILLNLLTNALKYSPKKNPVVLRLSEHAKKGKGKGEEVHVEVEDHGEGIDEKDLPFVFERFYRADKSRARKTGGLGVGLAIVKELVEAHGGTITVKSKEGGGTVFRCVFPRTNLGPVKRESNQDRNKNDAIHQSEQRD